MGVRVDELVRTGILCPEGHAGQQRRGHSTVLFQGKLLGAPLDTVIVAEVDMLPDAYELITGDLGAGKTRISFRQGDRPQVVKFRGRTGAPYQTAHMPHHQGVAVLVPVHAGRKPRLRGIEPVAAYLLLEDAAVRKAYPARPLAETVRVGDYRIAVALPCAAVAAGDVVIGAFDVFTPHHAGVVWHFECVIGHEQIVVAVLVYQFRSLAPLPARGGVTGSYTFPEALRKLPGAVGPGVSRLHERLSAHGVELQQGEAAVP